MSTPRPTDRDRELVAQLVDAPLPVGLLPIRLGLLLPVEAHQDLGPVSRQQAHHARRRLGGGGRGWGREVEAGGGAWLSATPAGARAVEAERRALGISWHAARHSRAVWAVRLASEWLARAFDPALESWRWVTDRELAVGSRAGQRDAGGRWGDGGRGAGRGTWPDGEVIEGGHAVARFEVELSPKASDRLREKIMALNPRRGGGAPVTWVCGTPGIEAAVRRRHEALRIDPARWSVEPLPLAAVTDRWTAETWQQPAASSEP